MSGGDLWGALPMIIFLPFVKLAIHLLTNHQYNFFRDELYYIACGEHLAWGYVDHPPLVALAAWFGMHPLGGSLRALRFLPALSGALTVLMTGLLARRLGGGRFAQALAALAVIVAPIHLIGGSIFTMNAMDFLVWVVVAWLLVRLLEGSDARGWLVLGLVAGIGLLNKISVLYFLGSLFVGLLLTPARRHLRTRWPWLAALVAAALFAPHLVWQARHGWPTLEFMHNAQTEKNYPISPLGFLAGQVLLQHPLTVPLWFAGLGSLLIGACSRRFRALGIAYLLLFVMLLGMKAKVYYLSPVYPILFAAGGVALEGFVKTPRRGWLRPATVAVLVAGGVVTAPIFLPVLPPERYVAYAHALRFEEPRMERNQPAALPQVFADQFGWEEMVAKIAQVYHSLPAEDRARCVLFAGNYGEAGAIDFYGPRYGLPRAASGHNNYFLWGPPDTLGGRGAVVITIGQRRRDVEMTYGMVTLADTTSCRWCMPFENGMPIYVGRGRKSGLAEIWSRCKLFI